MKNYNKEVFVGLKDRDSARVFGDMVFDACAFSNCSLSVTSDPARRTIVRNVHLRSTTVHACQVWCPRVEEVTITDLHTQNLLQCWGAVFRHVVLSGDIGSIMSSTRVQAGLAAQDIQTAFDRANSTYYSTVDWALDISEGRFAHCELRGVPARLVRRDPRTQAVLTRARALEGAWSRLTESDNYWSTAIELFLEREEPDIVLVAAERGRDFRAQLRGLTALRDHGIVDMD